MGARNQHQRPSVPVAVAPRERTGSQGGETRNFRSDDSTLLSNAKDVKMVQHALWYASLGWKVFPVIPGGKAPLIKGGRGFKDATSDPKQIEQWWGEHPTANIGLATGKVSGVWVLDLDLYKDPEILTEFQHMYGELPETYVQRSGRGGLHYFFRYNGGHVKSCSSEIFSNVDIRGDGGSIVLAPSNLGPDKVYKPEKGSPGNISPAPQKLAEAVRDMSEQSVPLPHQSTPKDFTGTTVYGQAALLDEIRELRAAPEGQRNETLNKCAFSLGQLIAGGELDEFETTTTLTSTAQSIGLETREIQTTIRSGIDAGMRESRTALQAPHGQGGADVAHTSGGDSDSVPEWPEIVPLDGSTAPDIPDNIIPGWAGDFVREAARSIQIPHPMAAASVLGAVSMAVSSVVKCIHVGPGHIETPNVYLFAPLLSGERKTGMVGTATNPLYEWEIEQAELKAGKIREAQSKRKTEEKIIEGMRTMAAKATKETVREGLIQSIAKREAGLEDVPSLPRLLADDATPESLPRILQAQNEVLGIISSEGGIFDIFGGRYSKDGIPNLDLLLKAHNGEPYRVDRIGRDPIVLNNPRLVVCICPQPDVLFAMAGKPGFRGRGLLARFLYFFSESQVGYRDISPDPMTEETVKNYSLGIKNLLGMRGANLELTISQAARALWLEFAQVVEEQMRPGGEFEHFRDWAGKLPGQAARLAGIFHCIEAKLPGSLEISENIMEQALTLAALLADHAKVAFSTIGTDPATEVAKSVLVWIQHKKREKFTLRDCFRDLAGRYRNTSEIKPGLSVLVERGYIKDIGMEQTGGKGRPKGPYFIVNPIVTGGDA